MKYLASEERAVSAGLLAFALEKDDVVLLARWAILWGARWVATIEHEEANRREQVRRKRVGQMINRNLRAAIYAQHPTEHMLKEEP